MKQEDKELLLRDLCARLPYRVKYTCIDIKNVWRLKTIFTRSDNSVFCDGCNALELCRPYLLPLSSMTEEQKKFFKDRPIFLDSENELVVKEDFFGNSRFTMLDDWLEVINWCYENHFDIYRLIPKKLAIDCTNLNIYKVC